MATKNLIPTKITFKAQPSKTDQHLLVKRTKRMTKIQTNHTNK